MHIKPRNIIIQELSISIVTPTGYTHSNWLSLTMALTNTFQLLPWMNAQRSLTSYTYFPRTGKYVWLVRLGPVFLSPACECCCLQSVAVVYTLLLLFTLYCCCYCCCLHSVPCTRCAGTPTKFLSVDHLININPEALQTLHTYMHIHVDA
jgi:hypothetical protein